MSERTLKQLVGAFAVVAAIWVLMTLVGRSSGSIEATGEVIRLLDGVDGESLESATFVYRGDEVVLTQEMGAWRVNGFPADPAVVSRFTDALDEVRIGDLTASNPANHDRMGVSADSAITVTLSASGSERSFLLGRAGRRFGTVYLRLPGSDDVYLLDGDLREHATRTQDSWRNRTMATVDTAAIAEIEVTGAGAGYAVVRGDSVWTLEGGAEADANAVQGILSELSSFVATGFLTDTDSIARLPEASSTVARSADGSELATITLGEGDGDRWARTSSDDYLYRVSSFRAGRVAPSRQRVTPGG